MLSNIPISVEISCEMWGTELQLASRDNLDAFSIEGALLQEIIAEVFAQHVQ